MTTRISFVMIVIVCVYVSDPSYAKGTTIQVTITGPGLDAPLHLSRQSITSANVWGGNFADWDAGSIDPPPADSLQYLVHFWVQFGPNDIQMKYVLRYQWHEESNRAIVCLPGRRDIWYRTNVYSILRDGQDGKCFYAAEDWGDAVRAALQ